MTSQIVDPIRKATSFEEAGLLLLRRMFEIVQAELLASRFAGKGDIVRGLIHLRSEDSYRQVLSVSRAGGTGEWRCEQSPAAVSSAKRWRAIAERQAAVSFDLMLNGTEQRTNGTTIQLPRTGDDPVADSARRSEESQGGETTHLFSIPLRAQGDSLSGMACIEVFCPSALGEVFIWDRCKNHLQSCCDLVAPYLLRLPAQPSPGVSPDPLLPVIGPSMAKLIQILQVFARQEETLLLGGPTGAGKSRLARWCHEQSPRRRGPFEVLDLSTVPESLQMAELCGWKRGAFTDASQDTPGSLSRAEGGTLFIDEIDKLSFKAQAGLLHVLEERRYRALGERAAERDANIRFIIGSNADLLGAVRSGQFREDLYYRINVLPIKVPPLSERRDEIIPWARYMVQRRHGDSKRGSLVSKEAEALLQEQPWPGNLRQLDNIMRRAYALRLADDERSQNDSTLTRRHIEQALQWESSPLREPTIARLLTAAAESFVRVAQQRPIDLDLADAFRGFVLAAAVRRLEDPEAAFRLLGKEQLVKNRNHQKVLKRELERASKLLEAIGEIPPSASSPLPREESDDVGSTP